MSKHLQSGQHPDADQICAFVDHALPVHEREEMLAHLAECTDCRETVLLSLPTIDRAPAAVKKSKSWFWDLRFLLPAGAVALAVVLLYIHQAKNPQREDVGRGPETALERPAPRVTDQKSSPGGAAGGAGSTSFAGRALPAPHRTAPARTVAAAKEQSETGNRLAVGQATASITVHLPDGRIPISTVTRGIQMLAIDERNQLFLSNDRGASWLAVQVPWRSRAVKAELTSYPIPGVARDKAASGIGAGFGAGLGSREGALKAMNSTDADQFEKQKKVRQELKGSYQAPPVNGASDAPSAAPASAQTAPAPSSPSSSRGSFSGVITDRSGAVISGASVVLTNQNDHASSTAVTGHDGRFHMDGLAAGLYQLEARAPGFNTTRISDLPIASSPSNTRNLVLDVGAATQTVTVQAAASEMESTLPELGRNAISLERKSASPNALVRPTPIFEVTTDSGDHWISSDGLNWQRR